MEYNDTESLWGDMPTTASIDRTPVTILKDQAALLGRATGNLLIGEVELKTVGDGDQFEASFTITAPTLKGYTFNILSIEYPIGFYPVSLSPDKKPAVVCQTEEIFKQQLARILGSEPVKGTIQKLINHVKADAESAE